MIARLPASANHAPGEKIRVEFQLVKARCFDPVTAEAC
jgi:hypothetical protein